MNRKGILWLVAICAIVGALIPGARPAGAATTISFWVRDSEAAFAQNVVQVYNASHTATQVKITIIPAAQYVTKFGTAVAVGDAPDVAAIDLVFIPQFNAANEYTDITTLAHKLPFYNQLTPSHIRLATWKGRLYAVPESVDSSMLFYNKGLFRQAGLDPNKPPTNWAQVEQDAKKITALGNGVHGFYFPGDCGGCNGFTMFPLIWADSGDVVNKDCSAPTMTSAPVEDAFNFYHRLWTDGVVPQDAKTDNGSGGWSTGFASGKIGMMGMGSYAFASLDKIPSLDWGVTYLPGKTGGWSSFAGGDVIGIPRGSRHVAAAWDFISWLLSDQVQTTIYVKTGLVPVRTDIAKKVYATQGPRYAVEANASAKGLTTDCVDINELINSANSPWTSDFPNAVFGSDVNGALTTMQNQLIAIIAKRGS